MRKVWQAQGLECYKFNSKKYFKTHLLLMTSNFLSYTSHVAWCVFTDPLLESVVGIVNFVDLLIENVTNFNLPCGFAIEAMSKWFLS